VVPSSLPLFPVSIDRSEIVNGHPGGGKQIGERRRYRAKLAFSVIWHDRFATETLADATVPS